MVWVLTLIALTLATPAGAGPIAHPLSESPGSRKAVLFSPFYDDADLKTALDRVKTQLKKQHYTVTTNVDATGNTNNNPETATADRFKSALQGNLGVLFLIGHGNDMSVIVEAHDTDAHCDAALKKYIDDKVFKVGELECSPTFHSIRITAAGISAYFKDNTTIVHMAACESWKLRGSFTNARDYIGYDFCVPAVNAKNDAIKFWSRMAGTIDNGDKRWANIAATPTTDFSFKHQHRDNTPDTVLSPAVKLALPTPGSSFVVPTGIDGAVEFDTVMDRTQAPDAVVTISGCNVDVTNRSWGNFGGGFDSLNFSAKLKTPGTLTISVKWSRALAKGNKANLDGNENPRSKDHFGPNRDDFTYTLACVKA